ncbi:MAG: YkgJ family cysteine cluster protein [Lachnospiraceae bacterium]|nr:YkgJ family cysteine cluster protein [Lachnospiraceae bacterium]
MLRQEKLEEITDGRRYGINDMVRADAGGCKGCSKCCETMTNTIILSPLDVYRIERQTGKSFNELLDGHIELNMADGLILPNIKANKNGCNFLSEDKRCTIHSERPDFCRLFPLGRLYEGEGFSYILQVGQCDKALSKVKVKKWIDTPSLKDHDEFVLKWHGIIKKAGAKSAAAGDDERKKIVMGLLNEFYMTPYRDFYPEFFERANKYEMEIARWLLTE